MSPVKKEVLAAGIWLLRAAYAPMKLLPVKKRYVFITKLGTKSPIDFQVLAAALRKRHPEYEIVMLCRPMKPVARYILHLFTQMYYLATSEVLFLERSCLVAHVLHHRKTLQIVQLWHALGSMKKFGYAILDTPEGQPADLARAMHMHEGYTWILISSKSFLKDYLEGFGTDGSNVVEIPLPRVDLLLDEGYRREKTRELIVDYPALRTKKNILYCPTFRGAGERDARAAEAARDLVDQIDFDSYNFIYSKHPVSSATLDDDRIIESKSSSTQDFLFVADYVVTDYSSVMYEAGLMGIPVCLYAYDWQDYRRNRSHNVDLEHDVPLLFSGDPKTIVRAIERDIMDRDAFSRFVDENVRLPETGTCCDAIIDLIDRCKGIEAT